MLRSLLGAIWQDDQPDNTPEPHNAAQQAVTQGTLHHADDDIIPAAIHGFNERLSQVHLAMSESNFGEAVELVAELEHFIHSTQMEQQHRPVEIANDTANAVHCSYCGLRVNSSIDVHVRSCAGALAAAAGRAVAAAAPTGTAAGHAVDMSDPRMEMLAAIKVRLVADMTARMESAMAAGRTDIVRDLWCLCARVGENTTGSDRVFAAVVKDQFMAFANDILAQFEAARHQLLAARHSAVANASGDVHPYVRCHLRTIFEASGFTSQQQPQQQHHHPTSDGASGGGGGGHQHDGGGGSRAQVTQVHSGPSQSHHHDDQQPHIVAIAALVGEASVWCARITEQPVPHPAQAAICSSLHRVCVEAVLPIVHAYRADMQLVSTVCVARALLDYAENRLTSSDMGSLEEWNSVAEALRPQQQQVTAAAVQSTAHDERSGEGNTGVAISNGEARDMQGPSRADERTPQAVANGGRQQQAVSESVLLVRFESAGGKKKGKAVDQAQHHHPPLPLPVSAGVTILDEASDQLSFLCSILERYLRVVTVALGLGAADVPSRTGDDLSHAMHELQGEYVLLERAYLENAVTRAVTLPGGWTTVGMGADPRPGVVCFAWPDHTFFILLKAVSRSCATYCDMATAAVCNFVSSCLDDAVSRVVKDCIRLCAERRALSTGGINDNISNRMAEAAKPRAAAGGGSHDDVEAELARHLQQALGSGRHGGTSGTSASSPRHAGAAAGGFGSSLDEDDQKMKLVDPAVSDGAIHACNTVAIAARFARSLYERTCAEVEAVFPAGPQATPDDDHAGLGPGASTSSGAISPNQPNAAPAEPPLRLPHCHQYLRGPLDTLRASASAFAPLVEDASRELASALIARGLHAMQTVVSRCSYVLTDAAYDAVSMSDPLLGSFHSEVVAASGLPMTLSRLHRPGGCDTLVRHIASAVAGLLERAWMPQHAVQGIITAVQQGRFNVDASGTVAGMVAVNEYGALLMSSQIRECQSRLAVFAEGGSSTVTRCFLKLQQVVAVLSLDSLPELYTLSFPHPALSRSEITYLLLCRVGLLRGQAALDAVQWDRVRCV